MKTYYVYILLCADGTYYTGMTNDLERRVMQHEHGKKGSYTFTRRPVLLKWYLSCSSPVDAIRYEKQIQGWSQRKKQALIDENWDDLVRFSKNYTEHGKPSKTRPSSTSSD